MDVGQFYELKGIIVKRTILASLLLVSTPIYAGVAYDACKNMPPPMMNSVACMGDTLKSVDKTLESTQSRLLTLSKNSYPVSDKEYVRIHNTFLDYRDRQCSSFGQSIGQGGTGAGSMMLEDDCKIELTRQRIDYLRQMISEYYE
ncbi:lysozyme inhibitor LprI family protein [Neptuniibacter sp. PT8_73]|uniref:lysozyme inhibitor LprI family protein n=1 Tax=Neptuniibacter sp. PT8_73 TaxID=3398206 RepID=UPI0039F56AF2